MKRSENCWAAASEPDLFALTFQHSAFQFRGNFQSKVSRPTKGRSLRRQTPRGPLLWSSARPACCRVSLTGPPSSAEKKTSRCCVILCDKDCAEKDALC